MTAHHLSAKRKVLCVALVFVVLLHGVEMAYRLYQYRQYGIPLFDFLPGQGRDLASGPRAALVVGHPLLHYVPNPERNSHTRDGFRVTDDAASPDYVIACMGGSSAYGATVFPEEAYPNQLQRFLNVGGRVYKVLNAAAPGWSLSHVLSCYVHNLRYHKPGVDMVILDIGYNDVWTSILVGESFGGNKSTLKLFPKKWPKWTYYRSLVWLSARMELLVGREIVANHLNDFAFTRTCSSGKVNPNNLERFGRELRLLLRILRDDDVKTLVMLEDTNGDFGSNGFKEAFLVLGDEIERIAGEAGCRVVNMREITHSRSEYFADVIHMTKLGNQVCGGELAKIAREMLE